MRGERDTRPSPMVRQYAAQKLPGIRRLLIARLNVASGQNVVERGAHANQLAENLADRLKRDREAVVGHLWNACTSSWLRRTLSRSFSVVMCRS